MNKNNALAKVSQEIIKDNTVTVAVSNEAIERSKVIENVHLKIGSLIGDNQLMDRKISSTTEVAVLAKEFLEKYAFETYSTVRNHEYLDRVITIKEFEQNKSSYIDKLSNGIGSFPLDIDYDNLSKIFKSVADFKSDGVSFQHSTLFGEKNIESHAFGLALKNAKVSNQLTDAYVNMNIFNFLFNYEKINNLIEDIVDKKHKEEALKQLQILKLFSLSIIKTIANMTIVEPIKLLENHEKKSEYKEIDSNNPLLPSNNEELEAIKAIEELILINVKGVKDNDLDNMLKINNLNDFSYLIGIVIDKILNDNKVKKIWLSGIDKKIEDYSTSEMVAFAAYIARNIIEEYATLDDMVENVLNFTKGSKIQGKCTDYTGLTLRILNNYLKVKYPEKFEGLHFGYDTQHIGEKYKHAYIKIFKKKNDLSGVEIAFIDPTMLASKGIDKLRNPKEILEYVDASNLPIQIDRTAEDILHTYLIKGQKKDNNTRDVLENIPEQQLEYVGETNGEEIIELTEVIEENNKSMMRKVIDIFTRKIRNK